MAKFIARFLHDRRGGVAIQFCLMMFPLMVLAGGMVDFTNVLGARDILRNAADAASIGAIAKQSSASKAAAAMTGDGSIPVGVAESISLFNANVLGLKTATNVTPTATVTRTGSKLSSTLQWKATVPLYFLGLVGMSNWDIGGTSQANSSLPPYMDFYVLLDNTPSMGIGATQKDIDLLVSNTGCAFACHDLSAGTNDNYARAKALGVKMRIDLVREATQDLVTAAQNADSTGSQNRMAIYTFGATAPAAGLTQVAALSNNLAGVRQQLGSVDLMSDPYHGYNSDQMTDFDAVLSALGAQVTPAGDGSTAASPQKVLFFISDGVADANYPTRATGGAGQPLYTCANWDVGGGRCMEALNTTSCDAIKAKGFKIAVLYTTYLPLDIDWYKSNVAPWAPQISQRMQACASEGLYFEVSNGTGISAALNALFNMVLTKVRLTN